MEKEQNHTKSVQLVPQHEYLSQRRIGIGIGPLFHFCLHTSEPAYVEETIMSLLQSPQVLWWDGSLPTKPLWSWSVTCVKPGKSESCIVRDVPGFL